MQENLDMARLIQIALHAENRFERAWAVERLNDKETLTYIALNDRARDARLAALHKLEDTDVLFKVAMHDPASLVRTTAIKMLDQKEMTDEELKAMLEAAQEDKIGEARIFIVKRIDDKEELIRIITHD